MPKPTYESATYSGTGEQTLLFRRPQQDLTIAVSAGASDVFDIEVVVQPAFIAGTPVRYKIRESCSGSSVNTFFGPVMGVGLTITTNVSGAIKLETLSSYRFG